MWTQAAGRGASPIHRVVCLISIRHSSLYCDADVAIAESVPVCWSKFAGLRNYTITPTILARIEEIGEAIGRAEGMGVVRDLRLRRINRIRTIRGSLAIEGNVLSEEQISTILDGKPVAGPLKDLQEARNAIAAYDRYATWNPGSERDLLTAHGVLMAGLLQSPGPLPSWSDSGDGRGTSRAHRPARTARAGAHDEPDDVGRHNG